MKRKKFLPILGIFFVSLIIFILAFFNFFAPDSKQALQKIPVTVSQPQKSVNVVLRDYKNSQLGISFKYPSDWNVADEIAPNSKSMVKAIIKLDPEGRQLTPSSSALVQIVLWQNPANISIDAYQQQVGKQVFTSCGKYQCNKVVVLPALGRFVEIQGIATPDINSYLPSQKGAIQNILSSLKVQ